ncbi:MAG: hypothetical protein AOA66_1533 [Candidatus Bathyarchaeota archaeon BA2]|nr:MAG: hypothetical protein AOA66_1533 [Candidatus Bathyarchaeota archaeon BA2]
MKPIYFTALMVNVVGVRLASISRFRDPNLVRKTAEHIKKLAERSKFTFMHVCGTYLAT